VSTPAAKGCRDQDAPAVLRHSFASLLFQEGTNPAEIAEQMGHSLQTLLGTYTHVVDELRGKPRRSAEALIRAERAQSVPGRFLGLGRPVSEGRLRDEKARRSGHFIQSRRPDSNRGPLHYEGRTSEGRASTRVHTRARFSRKGCGFTSAEWTPMPARARARVPVLYPPTEAQSSSACGRPKSAAKYGQR
jgi:hypothetical protein